MVVLEIKKLGLIRFLLAISVVIQHTSPFFGIKLWGGEMAVEMFFIISGFYMALILNEKYKTQEYNMTFYKNRLLKIFPIYLLTLIVTFIFFIITFLVINKGGALEQIYNNFNTLEWFSLYVILTNIFILGQDLLLFLGIENGNVIFSESFKSTDLPMYKFLIIPQSWTLSLELTFYLLAPFILRKNLKILFSIFFISLSFKISLFANGYSYDPWKYRFFFSELFLFILGAIIYKLYSYKYSLIELLINNKLIYKLLYFLFLILGFSASFLYSHIGLLVVPIIYLVFVFLIPLAFHHTKKNKFDRFIGELSYPIYIVHILISYFTNILFDNNIYAIATIIVSIIVSILINKLIQDRVENIRLKNLKETKN